MNRRSLTANAPKNGIKPSVKKKFQCTPYSVTCSYENENP
jgi:hypothetical protein